MGDYASKGVAGSGLGLGIAGTALGLLNNGNGLAGIFGGGNVNKVSELLAENSMLKSENYADKVAKEVYSQSVVDNNNLRTEMYAFIKPLADESAANKVTIATIQATQQAEVEKNLLREQLVKSEIEKQGLLAAQGIQGLQAQINCTNSHVGCLQHTVDSITKLVVPKDVVCPEYMPRYNSWTAPTTVTADSGAGA